MILVWQIMQQLKLLNDTIFKKEHLIKYEMMNKNKQIISFSNNQIKEKLLFDSEAIYDKFLNWISGEFDLYPQDEFEGLKIFLPEGEIIIRHVVKNGKIITKVTLDFGLHQLFLKKVKNLKQLLIIKTNSVQIIYLLKVQKLAQTVL